MKIMINDKMLHQSIISAVVLTTLVRSFHDSKYIPKM